MARLTKGSRKIKRVTEPIFLQNQKRLSQKQAASFDFCLCHTKPLRRCRCFCSPDGSHSPDMPPLAGQVVRGLDPS